MVTMDTDGARRLNVKHLVRKYESMALTCRVVYWSYFIIVFYLWTRIFILYGLVCLIAIIYKTYINEVLYNIQNKQSK